MFSFSSVVILFAAVSSVVGDFTIVSPNSSTTWTSAGPNVVEWTVEDPTSQENYFDIQLIGPGGNATFSPIGDIMDVNGIFAKNVSASLGYWVFEPICQYGNHMLPTGNGFSMKFLSTTSTETTEDVRLEYAFSQGNFSIVDGTPPLCITSTSGTSSAPTSGAIAGSSGGMSASKTAGAISGSVLGALVLCGVIAAVAVVLNRRRRRRKTYAFEHRLMSPNAHDFKQGGFVPLEERGLKTHDRKRSDFGVSW